MKDGGTRVSVDRDAYLSGVLQKSFGIF